MSHPIRVEQLLHQLRNFLPRVSQQFADGKEIPLEVIANSDTEHTVMIGNTGIGVDTGVWVPTRSIGAAWEVSGYRVFSMQASPATRNYPEDAQDVTYKQSGSLHEVMEGVGELLVQMVASNLPQLPQELQGFGGVERAPMRRLAQAAPEPIPQKPATPAVVIEVNGGVVNLVRSSVPMRVVILDQDVEGADASDVREVGGEEVHVRRYDLAPGSDPGHGGVAPEFVAGIFQDLAEPPVSLAAWAQRSRG